MTFDDFVKLIDAIAKLLSVVAWPLLVAFFIVRFGPALKGFFERMGELSLKGPGFEASAKTKQTEVAAALAAAETSKTSTTRSAPNASAAAREAAEIVSEVVTPNALRKTGRATLLWVDDRPDNNIYERQSIEALGARFVLATSTDEALEKIKAQHFDAIISDMGRPPDSRAGYTLLDQLRASGNSTPFVIYAASNSPEYVAEAKRHGALGCTNRAGELLSYVISALQGTR